MAKVNAAKGIEARTWAFGVPQGRRKAPTEDAKRVTAVERALIDAAVKAGRVTELPAGYAFGADAFSAAITLGVRSR